MISSNEQSSNPGGQREWFDLVVVVPLSERVVISPLAAGTKAAEVGGGGLGQ
jgi:hypothetical protein